MSFTVPTGLRRESSAKTRQDIQRRNVMLGLCDQSDAGRFRTVAQLDMQRRTPSATTTSDITRSSSNKNTDWPDTKYLSATNIVVRLKDAVSSGYDIPRLDQMQSPLNEVDTTRRRISAEINNEIESDIWTYITGLTVSSTATDNSGAGGIRRVTVGTAGSKFIDRDSPYAATGTNAKDMVLDVIDDFVLKAKRGNLLDGVNIYGSVPGTVWLVVPPELFLIYLVNVLRDKGYKLDALTESTLRRAAVFSSDAFAGQLGIQKLMIVSPNVAPVPTGNNNWTLVGGYSESIVAGVGPMITQVISPEQNQTGDGYVVRQAANPYYQLLNGDGIVLYQIHAD